MTEDLALICERV